MAGAMAGVALNVISPALRPAPRLSKRAEPPSKRIAAGLARFYVEDIADRALLARRLQFDRGDFGFRLAVQQMRNKRRKIEPLIGLLFQREDKGHGRRSFR